MSTATSITFVSHCQNCVPSGDEIRTLGSTATGALQQQYYSFTGEMDLLPQTGHGPAPYQWSPSADNFGTVDLQTSPAIRGSHVNQLREIKGLNRVILLQLQSFHFVHLR